MESRRIGEKRPVRESAREDALAKRRVDEGDAHAILNRIRQIVRALRLFDKRAQARYGLGAAQMFVLHVLQGEGKLTLSEVADRTATDQSSASLAVQRLIAEDYVSRAPGEEDRRHVILSLTQKGRALVRRMPQPAQEQILESLGRMRPRERAELMRLLDKLLTGMGVELTPTAPMLFQEGEKTPRRRRR